MVRRKMRLRKNNSYFVKIYPLTAADLQRLGLINRNSQINLGIAKELIKHRCDQKAYLRGAFLAGGSINNPEGAYHLEIITADSRHAADLCRLLNKFLLRAKVSQRKNWYVVYIKE